MILQYVGSGNESANVIDFDRDFSAQITASWLRCAGNLCMIAAGILLISLIHSVTEMQKQRYVRLYEDPD